MLLHSIHPEAENFCVTKTCHGKHLKTLLLHTALYTFTLITWIFNVYSCEVTTSFYLHLPALQRFGPLAAVLRGCDGTTFPLLWGRSVWIDLGPWASQTSTLIPQVAMLRKPFNRPVYMQLCLAIVASCFSGPATESKRCIEFVWFVNEKKSHVKRAEILMEIGLCEVWVCSSSMLGLDCFSTVNSSRLFWWIMLGTQIYHWFINIHVAGGVYRSHSSVRTLGTIAVVVFKNSYHASPCVWISCTAYLYNS